MEQRRERPERGRARQPALPGAERAAGELELARRAAVERHDVDRSSGSHDRKLERAHAAVDLDPFDRGRRKVGEAHDPVGGRAERRSVEQHRDLSGRSPAQRHGAEGAQSAVLLDVEAGGRAERLGQRLERSPGGSEPDLGDEAGRHAAPRQGENARALDADLGQEDDRIAGRVGRTGVARAVARRLLGRVDRQGEHQDVGGVHGVSRANERPFRRGARGGRARRRRPPGRLHAKRSGRWLSGRFPDSGPQAGLAFPTYRGQWHVRPAAPITVAGPWGIRTPLPSYPRWAPERCPSDGAPRVGERQADSGRPA